MTFDEIVQTRHSVRAYKEEPLPREILEQIADAGRRAPSAVNAQTWKFTFVIDADLRKKMADACYGQEFVAQAPAVLVAWATVDKRMECGQSAATVDCSIAMTYMILKATELSLGSCWLGAFSAIDVKQVLDLPDTATVVAVAPLGYSAEVPTASPRKALGEVVEFK